MTRDSLDSMFLFGHRLDEFTAMQKNEEYKMLAEIIKRRTEEAVKRQEEAVKRQEYINILINNHTGTRH